jgi:tRNA G18 (ribose-2'-O)-methylase SpoU
VTRRASSRSNLGFFGIGIWHSKNALNLGSLWRTADIMGASFVFTIGRRYREQASDTLRSVRRIPLWHFGSVSDLVDHLPHSCPLIGIELDARAKDLSDFVHPDRAAYLLGAEDYGLTQTEMNQCHALVKMPGASSMNVACAGSIVVYDRIAKRGSLVNSIREAS